MNDPNNMQNALKQVLNAHTSPENNDIPPAKVQ